MASSRFLFAIAAVALACNSSNERPMKDPQIERQATLDALERMRADGADLSKALEIDFHVAL